MTKSDTTYRDAPKIKRQNKTREDFKKITVHSRETLSLGDSVYCPYPKVLTFFGAPPPPPANPKCEGTPTQKSECFLQKQKKSS
jgi:hypothetical protein